MIGGQPCPVNWGYLPWTDYSGSSYPGAPAKFTWNKMVYDNDMSTKNYGNTGEIIETMEYSRAIGTKIISQLIKILSSKRMKKKDFV